MNFRPYKSVSKYPGYTHTSYNLEIKPNDGKWRKRYYWFSVHVKNKGNTHGVRLEADICKFFQPKSKAERDAMIAFGKQINNKFGDSNAAS